MNPPQLEQDDHPREVTVLHEELSDQRQTQTQRLITAECDPASSTTAEMPIAVLLDLSGNKEAALEWAAAQLSTHQIRMLNKAAVKRASKRRALSYIRSLHPDAFAIFTSNLYTQSALRALTLFGSLTGAHHILVGDNHGRTLSRTHRTAFLLGVSRLVLELIVGYGIIIPTCFVLHLWLRLLLPLRSMQRPQRRVQIESAVGRPLKVLYLRPALSPFDGGGMMTHSAGFVRGAKGLGHRLLCIESGPSQIKSSQQRLTPTPPADSLLITPTSVIAPSKAVFELWNSLIFTIKSLRRTVDEDFDFIYQRYCRFNSAGVALSIARGLPLALEFNGSEVWVANNWDPVGQTSLLERTERLNLDAADRVFVVSEALKHGLVESGIDPTKIVVNPNGADPFRFEPGSGGSELRRQLGLEDRVVVGFSGTFGPWHGAPVLARAARLVSQRSKCHFLFVGDGDERAETEAIIGAEAPPVDATFVGRIANKQMPAYLDACDILVSPHVSPADGSEFFGSPTKLFEYMSAARPVVASRIGQLAQLIKDGENGLLVNPGEPEDLARAIEALADDESLRGRLGAAARKTVIEGYTWGHNAQRVFDAMETG